MKIEILKQELQTAGKIKQFYLLKEIIEYYYSEGNQKVLEYFQTFLQLTDEYIAFDNIPDDNIKDNLAKTFQIVFAYFQKIESLELFHKYLPIYSQYERFISSPVPKAKLLQTLGFFYWFDQQSDKSIEMLEESLKLINKYGSVTDIPNRYTNLGYIYENKGSYSIAEKYYNEAMIFAKKNNSHTALFMAYAALGRLKSCQKKHEEAILFFKEAIALSETEDESTLSVKCNLANSFFLLKNIDESLKLYNYLKRDETKNCSPGLYYTVLSNMANIYIESRHLKEAFELLEEIVKYAELSSNKEFMAGSEVNIALIYYLQNNLHKAEEHILKALKCCELCHSRRILNNAFVIYADILIKQKSYNKAIDYLKKIEEYVEEEGNPESAKKLYKKLSECYEKLKDFKSALFSAKKYISICVKTKQEPQKEIDELKSNPVIHNTVKGFYFFKEGTSLISKELSAKIGSPIIGKSKNLENVINQTILAAGCDYANVLITGESGTGKELLARLLHYCSQRKDERFIPINSALFTSNLAQSSIFGHIKGAFTGAVSDNAGYLELANKGTLFLDEIGDMPLDIQAAFLRVIEEKKILPLGSNQYKKVNFRLVSATHQDMKSMIEDKTFRLDLYNRINTIQIHIPPLRERKEDIPLIINYLLNDICTKMNKVVPELSNQAINYLCDYDYPGNIRELNNLMQRLVLFNVKQKISLADIYDVIPLKDTISSNQTNINMNLAEMERFLINQAMIKCNNVQIEACKLLGISSYSLNRKLKKINSF
ncbi:MAG: sigma 54-interacting transcriptional regulator [Candidatus Cloacimonetes bacterium]|nr:sigma 54-interacting transcriptional regulator [Candidatus Cloacimonadota bacterium]